MESRSLSSSSDGHRHHKKKKKHRHHRRDSDLSSMLKTIRDEVASNYNSLHTEMQSISKRVENVEGTTRAPMETPAEQSLRQDNPVPKDEQPKDEAPDYEGAVFWHPEGDFDASEGEKSKLSTTTAKIVEEAFSCSLPNDKRRNIKRKQPVPDTPYTKCPKLDNTVQSKLPKPAKDADRASARIQTLVLDAATSLINILESARKGTLNTKEAAESAQQALKLLGNASANISMDRRRKATQHLNAELTTLIDDEESFRDAAPMLFGKNFDQRAKEHIEAVKSLKKTSSFSRGLSFQRGHPPTSRGGGNNRGRGSFRKPSWQPKKKTQ